MNSKIIAVLISIGILCLLIVSGFNGTLVGTESYGYGYGYSYGYYYETPTPSCSPTYVGGGGFIIYKNQTAVCPIIENVSTADIPADIPATTDYTIWIILFIIMIVVVLIISLYLNLREG